MEINFNQYHPIMNLEGNLIYASNGNVILGYEIELPEIYSLSDKDYEDLHELWFKAIVKLPAGLVIHKQDIYKKTSYCDDNLPDKSFLASSTKEYFKGRKVLTHNSYIYFNWPKNKTYNKSGYINPFKSLSKEVTDHQDKQVQKHVQRIGDTIEFLNQSGKIRIKPLSENAVLELTQEYFNGFNSEIDTDIRCDKSLQVGEHFFEVFSVNNELCFEGEVSSSIPNSNYTSQDFVFHQGYIDGFGLELDSDHIVNQIIFLDDTHHWRKHLEQKAQQLKKSINFGTQNRLILEKINRILDEINRDESSRIVRGHMNIVFWNRDEEILRETGSMIKAKFRELDITPYYPIGRSRTHLFLNSYFCHSSNLTQDYLYVTDLKHVLCLWINNTNYKNDPEGIFFCDRVGNVPVFKDVWDQDKRRINARNFAIFAPTGEGKSFLANNIIRQYYECRVRLVIIDLGGSYEKFARLYDRDSLILRYEPGKSLGINPFQWSGTGKPDSEHLEDLTAFLFELLKFDAIAQHSERVALKKLLQYYYHSIKTGFSLKGFYDFVETHKTSVLKKLGISKDFFSPEQFLHLLSPYVGNGAYSFLFEAGEDQCFALEEKRIIIFELDQVRDNDEVLSIMLRLIKSAVQRTVWGNKAERGIILFDEFAKQLKFPNVLESVEYYYQAIRKQNGAIGIILQSVNQLPENATSASILENTQVIYSLRNEKGYEDLVRRLKLSSHDLCQLKSIQNKLVGQPKYTEIFIKVGKESNVFRLEVSPEVYAAYLTEGKENDKIEAFYKHTGSMEKAIKSYLNKTYHEG